MGMLMRVLPLFALSCTLSVTLWGAPEWLMIRTVDGKLLEGQSQLKSIKLNSADVSVGQILSVHSGAPASEFEAGRIKADIAAIQGEDRAARDKAVEELTGIGLPVMTPLLQTYKDTDQHEPRPLYRLFERLVPSYADDFDRTLSLVRLKNGEAKRGKLSDVTIELRGTDGKNASLPWSQIRCIAVRQKSVSRSMQAHSLRHSTQIEYLDTGVMLTAASQTTISARGLVRLSWDTDSWASDADGLKVPGAPAYKTNMVDGQPFGALVGRVGAGGDVFLVGKKATLTGKPAGRLELAVNDNKHWQNNLGTFWVTMTATDAYDVGDAQ
jgi:hypothetical protein